MIYTLTTNPAIDMNYTAESYEPFKVNRTRNIEYSPNGKGINVSIVLKNLGIESIALGFIAGFTGQEIKRRVEEFGIKTDFVYIPDKFSRINVKLQSNTDGVITEETAINGEGPKILEQEVNEFMKKIENIKKDDFIVLAGSVSRNMEDDIYEKICIKVQEKGANIVADATGKLLVNVLKQNPFLIKPNKKELEEIFEKQINTDEEVVLYARKLQEMGAENVLISMDKDGAILITKDKKLLYTEAPKGKVVNSVGSGDSMVAGFITGYLKYKDYEKALKLGIAAGSASAFSKDLATREEIMEQLLNIEKGV